MHSGVSLGGRSLLAAALFLVACRTTPEQLEPAPDRLPRPVVTVSEGDGDKPYAISAACLPYGKAGLEAALARAGTGLRIAGRRGNLVIRRAALGASESAVFLAALGVEEGHFCSPEEFNWGDRIVVRSMVEGPPQIGFVLHLRPWLRADGRIVMETSAVARPPDGSLLPVLRAEVPVEGSGHLLLVGEALGERAFAVMLDLTVPGGAPGGAPTSRVPTTHDLRLSSYGLRSDEMDGALGALGLSGKGDLGGVAIHRIGESGLQETRRELAKWSAPDPVIARTLRSGGRVVLNSGTLRLEVMSEFSVRDFSYRTRVRVLNRETSRPVWTQHGERDALLLVFWAADGARKSRALLLQVRPVD